MRGTSGFQGIFRCLQLDFYKEIASQSIGRSLLYLLFLTFLVQVVISVRFITMAKQGIHTFSQTVVQRLPELFPQGIPEIQLEDGTVTSPVKQPFIIEQKDFTFVLDTTGEISTLDAYKNGFLITKNKLIVKAQKNQNAATEINEYNLADMRLKHFLLKPGDRRQGELFTLKWNNQVMNVTEENAEKILFRFALYLLPFLFVFMGCWFFVRIMIKVVIFSGISLIANAIYKAGLRYRQLFTIGLYAATVPELLSLFILVFVGQTGISLSHYGYSTRFLDYCSEAV